MKENMYTYHYFQNRALKRPNHMGNVIFPLAILSSFVYITAMFLSLIK